MEFVILFIKAVIVGISVSAPMGPVGVLVIRRTLHFGRKDGLLSGFGAASSDLIYATVTYLGLAGFFEQNDTWVKILGSILMMGFGLYLYFSNPNYDVKDKDRDDRNKLHVFLSSFLFTLSNPLVIFFLLALFTRFAVLGDYEYPFLSYVIVMLGIGIGALLWWELITQLVGRLRDRISITGLRIFNRIVAVIFMAVSLGGIVSYIMERI